MRLPHCPEVQWRQHRAIEQVSLAGEKSRNTASRQKVAKLRRFGASGRAGSPVGPTQEVSSPYEVEVDASGQRPKISTNGCKWLHRTSQVSRRIEARAERCKIAKRQ